MTYRESAREEQEETTKVSKDHDHGVSAEPEGHVAKAGPREQLAPAVGSSYAADSSRARRYNATEAAAAP